MIEFNNYKITNLLGCNDELLNIMELWNQEVGFIFPFYKELLLQKIFECPFFVKECSYAVYDQNKFIGFIIAKVYDNNEIMSKYIGSGWISLFYVARKYRKKGIGGKLLELAEKSLKDYGVKKVLIGSDYNNFFPGVPCDFYNLTERFLEKRGYISGGPTYDVMKSMKNYEIFSIPKSNFEIRYAEPSDKKAVLDFFEKNFYGRWYYEAKEFFEESFVKNSYLLAFDKDVVVGFLRCNKDTDLKISYNINWNKKFKKLEGYGPLGVDIDYRKMGISKELLINALNDTYNNGTTDVLIDWTGLIALYQLYGFEVWKSYLRFEKSFL